MRTAAPARHCGCRPGVRWRPQVGVHKEDRIRPFVSGLSDTSSTKLLRPFTATMLLCRSASLDTAGGVVSIDLAGASSQRRHALNEQSLQYPELANVCAAGALLAATCRHIGSPARHTTVYTA